jgi:hypothetical protein
MSSRRGPNGAGAGTTLVDAPIVRSRPLPVIPWVSAVLIDLIALLLLFNHLHLHLHSPSPTPSILLLAAALHLAALVPIVVAPALPASERLLGAAYAFSIPVFGAPLAAISLGTAGQGELVEADPLAAPASVEAPRAEELRSLGEALPTCEALLAGSIDERRAIIATLALRADAGSVALLRWALGAANPELAVESALAIEEMTASFEAQMDQHRKEMAETPPRPGAALAAAELATDAIEAGLAETALLPTLAHEARGYYSAALAADPTRAAAIAIGRARLELAMLHPDAALEAIDEVVVSEGDGESPPLLAAKSVEKIEPAEMEMLLALRDEAVMATHALPWESASVLASYHPASPPSFVRRRLSAARRLSGLHARGATGGAGVTVGVVQVPPPASTREVPVEKP